MKFMIHDKWQNALFLHWKVPKAELEAVMAPNIASWGKITLDTTLAPCAGGVGRRDEGKEEEEEFAWIGLVLLTEVGVGAGEVAFGFPRNILPAVTHHGMNIRTYVNGSGVYFFSLECDSALATGGAEMTAGIPYKLAQMARNYTTTTTTRTPGEEKSSRVRYEFASARLPGSFLGNVAQFRTGKSVTQVCGQNVALDRNEMLAGPEKKVTEMQSRGSRSTTGSWFDDDDDKETASTPCLSHSLIPERLPIFSGFGGGKGTETPFRAACKWYIEEEDDKDSPSRTEKEDDDDMKDPLTPFFVERYSVFSRTRFGWNWKGTVEHEPWPMAKKVVLEEFSVEGIDSYEPKELRGVLQRSMGSRGPDHCCFSPGVGPARFEFLKPI